MSFCQTRNRSAQSSNVAMRFAGIRRSPPDFASRSASSFRHCPVAPAGLAAREARRALLKKRANALAAVLGEEAVHLRLHLELERAFKLGAFASEQHMLERADRQR